MPTARPMMLASASGELKTRSAPYCRCRPCVTLKTPPLPGTCGSDATLLASATSSPKTTMRGLRAISSFSVRLMAATIVSGLPSGCARRVERRRTSDRRRARRHTSRRSRGAGLGAASAALGRLGNLAIDVGGDRVDVALGRQPFASRNCAHARDRIAPRFGLALLRRLVQPLVVGQRVRVRPDDLGVHERRLALAPHPLDRLAHRAIAGEEVGAVAAQHLQVRERLDQPRDVAARRLHFDRHRDRVAVVLDEIQDRRLRVQAVLSDSQNSPSLVAPSPIER